MSALFAIVYSQLFSQATSIFNYLRVKLIAEEGVAAQIERNPGQRPIFRF